MATPIQLPAETAKKYRFTRPIFGGPVFDFPAFGLTRINLATLTEQQADRLLRAGWQGIERVPAEPAVSPKNTIQPTESATKP